MSDITDNVLDAVAPEVLGAWLKLTAVLGTHDLMFVGASPVNVMRISTGQRTLTRLKTNKNAIYRTVMMSSYLMDIESTVVLYARDHEAWPYGQQGWNVDEVRRYVVEAGNEFGMLLLDVDLSGLED